MPIVTPELLYSLSGVPNYQGTCINYRNTYSSGFNVTGLNGTYAGSSPKSDSVLLLAAGLGIVAASGALEIITLGTATPAIIAAETALNSISFADAVANGISQCMPKTTYNEATYKPSQPPGCIRTPTINGAVSTNQCSGNGNYFDTYFNVFSSQLLLQVCIPITDFGHSGNLELTGENLVSQNCYSEHQCTFPVSSAEVNETIPILEAFTLGGKVTDNGSAVSDQCVEITKDNPCQVSCENFFVKTNALGCYNFYAAPSYEYTVSLPDEPWVNPQTIRASQTQGCGSDSEINFNLYSVTFNETGLPSGTHWSLYFDNVGKFSTSANTISVLAGNGIYPYSIVPTVGFTSIPSSGNSTIRNSNATVKIDFVQGKIIFNAIGLNGNPWSLTINGSKYQSFSNEISFVGAYGDYSYSIDAPTGYTASPSEGTVSLGSTINTTDITFTPTITYSVTFQETGLPNGQGWSAELGGKTGSSNANSITFNSVGDGNYSYSVPSVGTSMRMIYFVPSPSGGTISVTGRSVTIDVTFTLKNVGCVNGTTEVLLANFTYEQAQYLSNGSWVITYNTTTREYQYSQIQGVFLSNHTRQYTINGYLKVSAYQPILTSHGYVNAENISVNDLIYNAFTGRYVKVKSISEQFGTFTMFDFFIPPNLDYVAWDNVLFDLSF